MEAGNFKFRDDAAGGCAPVSWAWVSSFCCSGVVLGQTDRRGPQAYVDSATDDGGGKIRVSWSLQSEPEGVKFANDLPEKVCVIWAVVTDGVVGADKSTCFTSEAANQDDLVVDTGIGGDGPKTVYSVSVAPYYNGLPMWPVNDDKTWRRTEGHAERIGLKRAGGAGWTNGWRKKP